MMNEHGKSDRPVVPAKSPNKAGQPAAEGTEGSGLTKGNLQQQNASRTPRRTDAPSALERVRQAASKDKEVRFTALLHHIYNLETLRMAYFSLKKEAAPGVDGETWRHYGETLEDNLVQRATVEVLNAIYETDFLGFSYGFRPGRSQHNALDALYTGLLTKKVNWVLDVDIRSFFDGLSHEWLVKFVEHRVADRRVVRLIQKWLNAGVLEDGKRTRAEEGTPQGGSASPLLANVYLHYGAPGQTWCFQRVKFPPRQEVQPPHRESSLGSEETTNRTKRRQSDERAVTKVKRLSLVKYLTAGRQHRSGWKEPVGTPQMARWPETAAGSVSTARSDREASRDLGDPLWSWFASRADRVCRTIRIIPEKGRCHSAKSDSLIVLRARESRVHGEAAKQMKTDFRETSPAPTEAGV